MLLWCFSGDNEEGTAQRQLEKTVLASEKGFGEAESRRNNARLLITSMFMRREACRDAFLERAADAARPKPCLGRAPTGNMVRREVEVLLDGLADCRKASLVDARLLLLKNYMHRHCRKLRCTRQAMTRPSAWI